MSIINHNDQLPWIQIEPWRLAIWQEIGLEPHPGQTRLFNAYLNHQYTECEAGRGGGKSYFAGHGLVWPEFIRPKWTTKHSWEWPRFVLLVAPQQDQAEIIFAEVYDIAKKRGVPLDRDRESGDIITKWGSRLRCMTGKNPTAMRGYAWNLVVIDEGSWLKNARFIVDSVLKGTIMRRKGKIVIIGSPDIPGSFTHECMLKGKNPDIPEWGHCHFTSIENWFIPWMEKAIEAERRSGVPEDVLQREYYAQFVPYEGLVYPEYQKCIMEADEIAEIERLIYSPDENRPDVMVCNTNGEWARAIDFGFTNPHCNITHVKIGETIYAWDEYYKRQTILDDHAKHHAGEDLLYDYSLNVCDIAEPGSIRTLAAYKYQHPRKGWLRLKGKWILKGTKPPIVERVSLLRRWMATGRYKIHPRCKTYLQELAAERYPEASETKNPAETPVDAYNHGSSASGYLLWFWFGNTRVAKDIYKYGEARGKALEGYSV